MLSTPDDLPKFVIDDPSRPWANIAVPDTVTRTVSMLTSGELQALYWATRDYFTGSGAIIDAGCFVGGSTVALAWGLRDNPRVTGGRMRSYDTFEVDPYMYEFYFDKHGLKPDGDTFRNIFDQNILPVNDLVDVSSGDILDVRWTGGPIELLFLDLCKTWRINDFCTQEFFPHLIPAGSLVIQQDYFYAHGYYIVAMMELLSDRFEHVGDEMWDTAVFRPTDHIPASAIPTDLRELGLAKLSELLASAIDRQTTALCRTRLKVSRAALHFEFGDIKTAFRIANEAQREAWHWTVEFGLRRSGLWSVELEQAMAEEFAQHHAQASQSSVE